MPATPKTSLQARRAAKRLTEALDFLVDGERALLQKPLSQARVLTLLHLLTHQRETVVEALPLMAPQQRDYIITLLSLRLPEHAA